jgi:hypothetical protein
MYELTGVTKTYRKHGATVLAVRDVDVGHGDSEP